MKRCVLAFCVLAFSAPALASIIQYQSVLSGANESPANASPGSGVGSIVIDTVANTMQVTVSFSGLLGTTTASHIHCCTPSAGTGTGGVATQTPTFSGFPLGVTSGTYTQTFDLTAAATYNPAFITSNSSVAGAETALLAGMAAGRTYLNIHSSVVPGGEIRGFLTPTPEPASFLTAGFTLLACAPFGRRLLRRR